MALNREVPFQPCILLHTLLLLSLFLLVSCGGIVPASAPKVISSSPSHENNSNFPLNRGLSVTFNKTIDPASLNENTFFIHEAGVSTALPAEIATDGVTARLKPVSNLKFSSSYVLTVNRGVKDSFGNLLSEVFQLTFTTVAPSATPDPESGLDIRPPRILSTSPSNGASGVRLDSIITVIFDEAIDPASLTPETFDVSKGTEAKNLFLSGQMAVFEPEADLRSDEDYTVTITSGIKDLAGNALVSDFIWIFSTEDDEEDEDLFN